MTSKEKLEDIRGILYEDLEFHMDADELINPIKQDLERLEKLEKENESLKKARDTLIRNSRNAINELNTYMEELEEENKKLKQALDIIKTKKVDIDMFIDSTSAEDYNNRLEYYTYINPEVRPLTKEEYELLKEVLGNE